VYLKLSYLRAHLLSQEVRKFLPGHFHKHPEFEQSKLELITCPGKNKEQFSQNSQTPIKGKTIDQY
jgi:hypothetical protein